MTLAESMALDLAGKTDAEKLAALVEKIKSVVPYVTATVAPWGHEEVKPDWIAIHKGRANSSHSQLEGLRIFAEALLKTTK